MKVLYVQCKKIHEYTTGLVAPNFEAIVEKSYANAVKNIELNSSALAEAANRSVRQTELDQKQVREKNIIVLASLEVSQNRIQLTNSRRY